MGHRLAAHDLIVDLLFYVHAFADETLNTQVYKNIFSEL